MEPTTEYVVVANSYYIGILDGHFVEVDSAKALRLNLKNANNYFNQLRGLAYDARIEFATVGGD